MKMQISTLRKLVLATLAATPALAFALPSSTTPYYTDTTNSYVQDQTSQVMGQLNNILCYMGAMGPDLMVGGGNYIALVDQNVCEASGSGGQSGNTGPAYTAVVVNSSRATNSDPMKVKAWVEPQPGNSILVYATATQAPSTTLPYGVFRMDYCGGASCAFDKGFINATSSGGLTFFSSGTQGSNSETTQLLLNATSSTAGSGAIAQAYNWGGGSGTNNFLFQYNANYFVRNDGTAAGDVCFDRSPANANESVWRYGLYDATSGARVTRNSGFPVEYTDTSVTPNVTYNGYIGYYGLWMPISVPSGSTVQQVTYSNTGATKTPYQILETGGKLTKFTTATSTLAALNKVTFWYYANQNVGTAMIAGSQYELYWDDTAKQFYVSGKQGTSGNMEPYATPVAVANTDMVAANSWGLFGWSQMLGGQFGIKGSDFANLTGGSPSTIIVKTQIQDVVYPSQYAAIGNLSCINDCPTAALITTSNAGTGTAYSNPGWTPVTAFVNYTLNATSGNMVDAASADVVNTATSGVNANGVRSGRMVTAADLTAMISAKEASGVCGSTTAGACSSVGYNQGDVDFLPVGSSFYVWETGANPWNQLAILMNGSTPVTFDPPLQVSYVVPTGAKYGSYQGATISLQYGGFGDLWGIPNECIDLVTNAACDFTQTAQYQQQNFRWTPNFSIPFDATGVNNVVTVSSTQGSVTAGTQYLAKPLDKEVRLANVSCSTAGLSTSGLSNAGLPVVTDFVDPTASVGTKPTVTDAPKVIHGVKQY